MYNISFKKNSKKMYTNVSKLIIFSAFILTVFLFFNYYYHHKFNSNLNENENDKNIYEIKPNKYSVSHQKKKIQISIFLYKTFL
jgi:hypothetical protein